MLKNIDRHIAERRKKKFEYLNLNFPGINQYSKFSLNCGCSMCRGLTQHHRFETKSKKLKDKLELRKIVELT